MQTKRRWRLPIAVAGVAFIFLIPAVLAFSDRDVEASAARAAASAQMRQQAHPVDNLKLYLAGVHVMKANVREWWNAQHYCERLRPDLVQCAVYDTTTPGVARLNAVEYIVPAQVYQSFPAAEKQYWHPHAYEVDGGLLDVPEMPADSARAFLQAARTTYGKTWHLWETQRGGMNARFPMGTPELAWSIEGPDSVPAGVKPRGNALTRGRPGQ